MVNSLENIDKSKVYVDRIEGLDEVVSDVISDTLTGAVSTITTTDLTAGKILVSDNNGKVAAGSDTLSDLVHKAGNEIITGDKSFNSSNDYHYIHIGNTSHSYDETVNNSLYSGITFEDKNNAEVGFVRRAQNSTDNILQLGIKGKDGTLNQSFLGIDSSGNKYMTAPTPTDTTTTSGNQVATTGWVNSTGNNVVHLSGNETITGVKTFSSPIYNKLGGTYINYTSQPQSYMNTTAYDSTGKTAGQFDCYTGTNGITETRLIAFNPDDSSKYSLIVASVDANGNPYTYAQTPNINSNDNNIATTAWVKSQGYMSSGTVFPNGTWVPVGDDAYMGDMNYAGAVCFKGNNGYTSLILHNRAQNVGLGFYIDEGDNNALKLTNPTYSANAWGSVTAMMAQSLSGNGYVKFNHGLIIQWGTAGESNPVNLTFPTPFTSTNYSITAIQTNGSANTSDVYVKNKSVTGCTLTQYATKSVGYSWIAIGY